MNRYALLVICLILTFACGCGRIGSNPGIPNPELSVPESTLGQQSLAHLWGYYDVHIDLENKIVEAIPNRTVMGVEPSPFNVIDFINHNPANLDFDILEILEPTLDVPAYDILIDVSMTHPFPGMDEYNGYDVKGICIGNGSKTLSHSGVKYSWPKLDLTVGQTALYVVTGGYDYWDHDDGTSGWDYGEPDGYTRWWNPAEFVSPGILGYTTGIFSTKDFTGTATLNPFKYFSDGIGPEQNLEDIFVNPPDPDHRTFSAGSTNARRYHLHFPSPDPDITFNYAILAHWEDEDIHPAYGVESTGVVSTVEPDLFFVDDTWAGGELILDIAVLIPPPDDNLEAIFIESEIFTDVYQLDESEMIPLVGGNPYISTYHTEIPATNLTKNGFTEFWIMLQYKDCDYQNDLGVWNQAGDFPLTSYFRHLLYIADEPYD